MATRGSSSLLQALSPFHIGANLWRHRHLAWQFALREVQLRHKGSRLGFLWTLINPLSMLALYAFVFGLLFGSRFGGFENETFYDFALALFLGLSLFHVFSEALSWSPNLITAHPNFVKKVVFPLEILPFAKLCDSAFHLAVSLGLVLVCAAFGSKGLTVQILWLPLLVLPLLMVGLGLAWCLAAVGVFLRDIGQVTAFITAAMMAASAVFFAPSRIEQNVPAAWEILRWNPLLQVIDLSRRVVLWGEPVAFGTLAYVYAFAILALVLGHAFFMVLRRSFAEVV